ncbi:lymphocyte antigen 6E-like [Lacerta agilis]|uniref:lymphocyte antigen 6E-like n=1 Tax=Lacerta agilis TaxID=80427 RepID=UPI0014199472|nr:lymphocyte antigen 6E-like [Lacerta agilis]
MKASFAALLAVLLCVERVAALTCFQCENEESNWSCLKPKTCNSEDKHCVTKFFGGGIGDNNKKSISKYCSPVCPKGGIDIGIMAFSLDCCDYDLCNINGAAGVKSSSLILAVGTLVSLLYIFGAKL